MIARVGDAVEDVELVLVDTTEEELANEVDESWRLGELELVDERVLVDEERVDEVKPNVEDKSELVRLVALEELADVVLLETWLMLLLLLVFEVETDVNVKVCMHKEVSLPIAACE